MTLELLGNYLFQFFIVAVIGFVGTICSDYWTYKKYNQKFNAIEDLIGGIFTSFSMNFAKLIYIWLRKVDETQFNYGAFLCIVFFFGVFSIEIIGFIMHPGFIIKVIKGVLKHSGKGVLEGIGEAIEEQDTENKEEKKKDDAKDKDKKDKPEEDKSDEKDTAVKDDGKGSKDEDNSDSSNNEELSNSDDTEMSEDVRRIIEQLS